MTDSWMYQPASTSTSDSTNGATNVSTQPGHAGSAGGTTPSGNPSALHDSNSPESRHASSRIRRRNRVIMSCLECRRRKLKCDKQAPCTNCTRFKRDCLYLAPALDASSAQKLAEIKEKMGALEQNLGRQVAAESLKKEGAVGKVLENGARVHEGGARVTSLSPSVRDAAHVDVVEEEDEEDDEVLEPTPLAALDSVYGDGDDDELMDLGIQIGRMRITERIGGFIRPKLASELNETLKDDEGGKPRWSSTSPGEHRPDIRLSGSNAQSAELEAKSYIGPGPDYIAPASSFFFPGTNMSSSLLDYLPSRNAADALLMQYFHAVHYMCRAVHRPTFERQYAMFWAQIATGNEPVPAIQAIVFAAMFSGAVSMDELVIMEKFGTTRTALIDSLRSGTEFALSKANFLRTSKVDTMQAFVMYLIPQVRGEVSRAHSALVGTAIRLAECMGLHRDGTHYAMNPVDVHVRRLIWYQLCFLDMRTCEATGPRPQIRRDDYDTQFPLNVDDFDLMQATSPTEDKTYWTDMTLMRIRIEFIDLRRALWFDMVQIDKKKKSLTAAVVKVQKVRTAMQSKYLPMIDEAVPVQLLAKALLEIGVHNCFIQVLHRYLFSTTTRIPDRLRQLLIEAGLTGMKNGILLDTAPALAPWAWYRAATQQYHVALLLLVEIHAYPMRKDAAEIWKCLDHIFDIPSHLSPKQKGELVLTDLRDRLDVYHSLRQVKATTQMEERAGLMDKTVGLNASDEGPPRLGPSLPLPPAQFGPPSGVATESTSSGSQMGSSAAGGDVQMQNMEDIDWAEWDQYFPVEGNSGDLDIPDFDFSHFTSGYSAPLDSTVFGARGTTALDMPSAQELADMNFTPTLFANPHLVRPGGGFYE